METQYQFQKALADMGNRLQRIEENLGDKNPAKNDWLSDCIFDIETTTDFNRTCRMVWL